jgi:superfamily II DNA or RNA helicase
MSQADTRDLSPTLLPHQAALVETALDPSIKRVVLRGDVGLGKGAALIGLATRLLKEQPASRVLVLVPAVALQHQFVERFREQGIPAVLVDRYRLREMLDVAPGSELWRPGLVAVLSLDFAKRPDVRDRLTDTQWDLVIADEAHSIRGARAEVLRAVMAVAQRVVLTTLPGLDLPDTLPIQGSTVVQWNRDRIVDAAGTLIATPPRPLLHEVAFSLTAAELHLSETVGGICRGLSVGTPQQQFVAEGLRRSLRSSPAALEARLRTAVKVSLSHAESEDVEDVLDLGEDTALEDDPVRHMSGVTEQSVTENVYRALHETEVITNDSKLTAVGGLLDRLAGAGAETRICVFTEYLATLHYLAADVENRGLVYRVLHGGMNSEDRLRSLTEFTEDGGVLMTTRAVMTEGVSVRDVTDLVMYDIPSSRLAIQQLLGRFDRLGRRSRLRVHVLVPSNDIEAIPDHLALLREVLTSTASSE